MYDPRPPPYDNPYLPTTALRDTYSGTSLLTARCCCPLQAAREDLLSACRRGLAHGCLLLLRYLAEDVPWAALVAGSGGGPAASQALRSWMCRLLDLMVQVGAAGWAVCCTSWCR